MATIPHVALLVETSREYGREVLRGVMRYARLHGPWAFHITPGDFLQAFDLAPNRLRRTDDA